MRFVLAGVPILVTCAFGQSGPTLVGLGYSFHAPTIAPGEILQIEVSGLQTVLSPSLQKATTVPLPYGISGISVTVQQSVSQSIMGTPVLHSYKAPLVSLNQVNLCWTGATPDCLVTFIALQTPYELLTNPTSPPVIQTQMIVSENGADGQAFDVGAVTDQIHVVTTCEGQPWQTGCPQIVTHANGAVVSALSPAVPGETVVIYAWGLGATTGAVTTGSATPAPAPVVTLPGYSFGLSSGLLLGFNFAPNAGPSRYFPAPLYPLAYLTPGSVGLYQVNVQLPPTFPVVPPCGEGVQSNLTIDLAGPYSFDGAAICVQAGQ